MNNFINECVIEYENVLPEELCDDLIEKFENHSEKNNKPFIKIPKNNNEWKKMEKFLYKELLIKINDYKLKLLKKQNEGYVECKKLISSLNEKLYLKSFVLQKHDNLKEEKDCSKFNRIISRHNVLTFIFYLNDVSEGGMLNFRDGIFVLAKKGKLVLFPENMNFIYKHNLPISNSQYVILGQLSNDSDFCAS
jgi:hypothetical protein